MKYLVPIPAYGWQSEPMGQDGGELEMSLSSTVAVLELEDGMELHVPLALTRRGGKVVFDPNDRHGPVLIRDGEIVGEVDYADITLVTPPPPPKNNRFGLRLSADEKEWVLAHGGADMIRRLVQAERARQIAALNPPPPAGQPAEGAK